MNLELVDWLILGLSTLGLAAFSIYSVRHMKGVADFLVANRCAGRYLLSVARGMVGIGAVSAVASFEMHYQAGFVPSWWQLMYIPLSVIIILTGYVYYRFRETRALTMAQFFEMRYSKPLRIYAGIITWLSGVLNFAIFPIVEARFLIWFCGIPVHYANVLGFQIDVTAAAVMVLTTGISLIFATLGGQITVMATDAAQGVFCLFAYLFIVFFLLTRFSWVDITTALKMAPEHASMLNPYDTAKVRDFNIWFFLVTLFGMFYGYMSWQGGAGYQAAGVTPHEQKMGAVISNWRGLVQTIMIVMIPICAYAFLHLPKYAEASAPVEKVLQQLPTKTLQTQMRVPVALAYMLPAGLKGLFATVVLFFLITTQDTYMHSWGAIFIQDVILPFRKKPFTPKQHVNLIRLSIIFVGVFAILFGLLYRQTEYVFMFFAITGAIVSGLGACIVGGIYWSRGTPAGAFVALTLGWVLALGRIVLQQIGPHFKDVANRGMLLRAMDYINGINSQIVWFWIMVTCLVGYVVTSLLTRNEEGFCMDRVLHRGKYAIEGEHVHRESPRSLWQRMVGVTEEFSTVDRIWAYALVIWNMGWLAAFLIGTGYYILGTFGYVPRMSQDGWSKFWKIWVWMQLFIGVPVTFLFAAGCIFDLRDMFRRLRTLVRNAADDGRVIHHHLATESDEPPRAE